MAVLSPPRAGLATPLVLLSMPDFLTIDGQHVPYAEGIEALRTGHALLVGGLLVCPFTSSQSVPYPTRAA